MKKKVLSICFQFACFALCFVLCAMFMFHIGATDIVPQEGIPVNIEKTKKTVILDPGHGGEDSGAVGIDGILEKDLNLSVCGILSELLSASGFEVIQTRTEDVMLGDGTEGHKKSEDLKARVELAKQNPDAYYVSIHMNKFPKEYCKGIQLFYSPNNQSSLPLAQFMHTLVKTYFQTNNNREVKNGSEHIYLMNRIQNPAILVECGFVSNPEEAQLLQAKDYQKKIALLCLAALSEARTDSYSA